MDVGKDHDSPGGSRVTWSSVVAVTCQAGGSLEFPRPFNPGSSHQERSDARSPNAGSVPVLSGSVPAVGPSHQARSPHAPGLHGA